MVTQPARAAQDTARSTAGAAAAGTRLGLAIMVIAGAQLMVALDVTIVNIALPHIQTTLHFSRPSLAWVIDSYTLVFAGLMLLGGRAADFLGRKRMFIAGLGLFSVASLAGGFATTAGLLIAARAAQGVGAALGVIAGGLLTDLLSWRWVLFVNVIIGGLLIATAPWVIPGTPRKAGRPSVPSAVLSVLGVGMLVYGFIHAASSSWGNPVTAGSFAVAVAAIAGFIVVQARSADPLLPLRLFRNRNRNRNRAGSYLMAICVGAAMFSMFYFLSQYVQEILGYSPIRAGLSFLPMMAMLVVTAQIAGRIIGRTGPRPLLIFGAVWVLAALAWLSQISASSSYMAGVLPALLMIGAGVAGVTDPEAGIASATFNMFFQTGGALGIAALTTVSVTATRDDLNRQRATGPAHGVPASPVQDLAHALAHGWGTAFAASGGVGRRILGQALAAGQDVTVVVRNPAKLSSEAVRIVTADMSAPDPAALQEAVQGADAVLSGLGPHSNSDAGIATQGTRAIVAAMQAAGVRRIVVISAAPVGTVPSPGRPAPPRHDAGDGFFMRNLGGPFAKTMFGKVYADLAVMEDILRDSGLDWTAVRPPKLTGKPLTGSYRTGNGHNIKGGWSVPRADVAQLMLRVLDQPGTIGQVIGIAT